MGTVNVKICKVYNGKHTLIDKGTHDCNGDGALDIIIVWDNDDIEHVRTFANSETITVEGNNTLYVFPTRLNNGEFIQIFDIDATNTNAILLGDSVKDIANIKSGINYTFKDDVKDIDLTHTFETISQNMSEIYNIIAGLSSLKINIDNRIFILEDDIRYGRTSLFKLTKYTTEALIEDRLFVIVGDIKIDDLNQNKTLVLLFIDNIKSIPHTVLNTLSPVSGYKNKHSAITFLLESDCINIRIDRLFRANGVVIQYENAGVDLETCVNIVRRLKNKSIQNSLLEEVVQDHYGYLKTFLIINTLVALTNAHSDYEYLYCILNNKLLPINNKVNRNTVFAKDKSILLIPPLKILVGLYPQLIHVIKKYIYRTRLVSGSYSQMIRYNETELSFEDIHKSDIDMSNMIIEIFETIEKESNGEV